MEKIVSILSLLKKDQKLVYDLDELNQDVKKYTQNIKSDMECVATELHSLRSDIKWYQDMAKTSYEYGDIEAQAKWLNKAEERCKEKEVAQAKLSVLQHKFSLSDDEFIALETVEITKQICEVRAEISKQLNLKV